MRDSFDVVVVGAGAAGIAALGRLSEAGLDVMVLEAAGRIGGRAHSVELPGGYRVDLGCEWLHSADRNVLAEPIERAGFTVDRSPPPWSAPSANKDFPLDEQRAFHAARAALEERLEAAAARGIDRPAADFFEPGGRWNPMIDAGSSFYNGAEFDEVSVLDYAAYEDSGVNWRVREGYGTAIASLADGSRIITDCPVTAVRRDDPRLRLETPKGVVTAKAAIVCVPSSVLAQGRLAFIPPLPEKQAAAAGLPLGLADKVFLRLDEPQAFAAEGHLLGRTDRAATGSYHLRPLGRPLIAAFLGGRCARALEAQGRGAMTAFVMEELTQLLGSDVRRTVHPLVETAWAADPWVLGSYSHALPGHAGDRAILAAPEEGRLFFAGEATHPNFFSTAHGAWESGLRAAEEALHSLPI